MRLRCLRYHYNLEYRLGQRNSSSKCPRHGSHNNGIRGTCCPHRRPNYDSHATGHSHPGWTVSVQKSDTAKPNLTSHTNIHNSRLALTRQGGTLPSTALWTVRHDLTEKDGILFKGSQAVALTVLCRSVPESTHDGHFGRVKCLERAKNSVYWLGYLHDIENKVARCSRCQEGRNENPRLPYTPHPIPLYPYQKIGMDMFELNGLLHLLSVDYFSKWITVTKLNYTRCRDIIETVDEQFANSGIPKEVISDNGPQFACADFRRLAPIH